MNRWTDLLGLTELHRKGLLHQVNSGPTPEMLITLFTTHPTVWRALFSPGSSEKDSSGGAIAIWAENTDDEYVSLWDLDQAIQILGDTFYHSDAFKIQGGQEYGDPVDNVPSMIFLWWD